MGFDSGSIVYSILKSDSFPNRYYLQKTKKTVKNASFKNRLKDKAENG
jgi:hypothetical protein